MRSLLAVTAVLVGMSVSGTAQQPKPYKGRPTDADTAPRSTPTVKAPATTSASATSKELRSVERETPKGSGRTNSAKKAPRAAALKPAKDGTNPPINFGGKSRTGGGGGTKPANPYQGRLKQKGSGRQ